MKARIALIALLVLSVACVGIGSASAEANTPQTAAMIYNRAPVSGALAGSRAGAYWYAHMDYPGKGQVVTIEMTFYPADPVTSRGVGFNLYGASNGQLVGRGKHEEGQDAGFLELQYASEKPERLLLQVFNYMDGVQVHFTVTAKGLPPLPVVVSGSPQATLAAPAAAVGPMSGTLAGAASGTFARYMLTFKSAAPVTLMMTYAPSDQIIRRGVGFRVYGPAGEAAIGGETGAFGQVAATFVPVVGAQYLIQVENYIPGVLISYTIRSSASK